jgi:hypothetical protein
MKRVFKDDHSSKPLLKIIGFGLCLTTVLLIAAACGKSSDKVEPSAVPLKPKQAASQLDQAFVKAEQDVKSSANVASTALQAGDYEKAIETLEKIKARGNLSFDQGVAIHNSMVTLEHRLILAADAGDANAKRAYELLKKTHRN